MIRRRHHHPVERPARNIDVIDLQASGDVRRRLQLIRGPQREQVHQHVIGERATGCVGQDKFETCHFDILLKRALQMPCA